MNISKSTFDLLYDTYSGMLYAIALEIAPSRDIADRILITTFVKIFNKDMIRDLHTPFYIDMVHILIRSAHEEINPDNIKNKFRLSMFAEAPVINELFCEEMSLEQYCTEHNMTRRQVSRIVQKEYTLIVQQQQEATLLRKTG